MKNENLEEKEVQESADNQVEEQNSEDILEEEKEVREGAEDEEVDEEADTKSELEVLQDELSESKDKYLRLYSEFENFRRRTAKEKGARNWIVGERPVRSP